MDLNRELSTVQQKIKLYETSALMAKRNIERGRITIKEVQGLSEHHKTYTALGINKIEDQQKMILFFLIKKEELLFYMTKKL
jgi:hypothetical protein